MPNLLALVVLALTLAFAAPARAAEVPAETETVRVEAAPTYELTPLKLAQRDVRISSAALGAGLFLAVSGPIALVAGGALLVYDGLLTGTMNAPAGIGLVVYGVGATPLGVVLTVTSGAGLARAKRRVEALESEALHKGEVRLSIAPRISQKSVGFAIAATW